jgi:phosphoribosylpyrophosphate synthetase
MSTIAETSNTVALESLAPINPELKDRFYRLHEGIHSREDPVTWRTLGVQFKMIIGLPEKQAEQLPLSPEQFSTARTLVETLIAGSFHAPLAPEIMSALGFSKELIQSEMELPHLEFLIVGGRHLAEPLTFNLADELATTGHSVAFFQPIGHYNDGQRRTVGIPNLLRPVDHLIILGSTQEQYGGNLMSVKKAIRLLSNENFTPQISRVTIVIPMVGSSRSHRPGQADHMGYEIRDASDDPQELASTVHRTMRYLKRYLKKANLPPTIPQIRFISIDIHNLELPNEAFSRSRLEFISADPAPEIANAVYQELEGTNLLDLPIKALSCDEGADTRTESLASELLHRSHNHLHQVDVVHMRKTRSAAGKIEKTWIDYVERWTLQADDSIDKQILPVPSPENPSTETCILVFNDDIGDTMGTGENDTNFANQAFPAAIHKIFAFTHPVVSQGIKNLDRVHADRIFAGNTLNPPGLADHPKVKIVDLAPTIARALRL